MTIKALLVDLDGTLIDTAPDLIESLQLLLEQHGRQRIPYDIARPSVPNGSHAIVRAGFGNGLNQQQLDSLRDELWAIYEQQLYANPQFFAGLAEAIEEWESRGNPWGVVTNKPAQFTRPLLQHTGVLARIKTLVCGDSLPKRKPDPMPLLHAASELNLRPDECVYLGDDERDVIACRAAGMPCIVAAYDYLPAGTDPAQWGADAIIRQPSQLLDAIASLNI